MHDIQETLLLLRQGKNASSLGIFNCRIVCQLHESYAPQRLDISTLAQRNPPYAWSTVTPPDYLHRLHGPGTRLSALNAYVMEPPVSLMTWPVEEVY